MKPYKYNGSFIRYAIVGEEKCLVVKDISRILNLSRPENLVKSISPENCHKVQVRSAEHRTEIMWVLTGAGLMELINKKCNQDKVKGFKTWLRERNIIPVSVEFSSNLNVSIADTTDSTTDTIAETIDTTTEMGAINKEVSNVEELVSKLVQWLKACPINLNEA